MQIFLKNIELRKGVEKITPKCRKKRATWDLFLGSFFCVLTIKSISYGTSRIGRYNYLWFCLLNCLQCLNGGVAMKGIGDVIGYILTGVGGLITAITLFYKAFSSGKQNSLANLLNEKDKEIKQKNEDAEIYRRRC